VSWVVVYVDNWYGLLAGIQYIEDLEALVMS